MRSLASTAQIQSIEPNLGRRPSRGLSRIYAVVRPEAKKLQCLPSVALAKEGLLTFWLRAQRGKPLSIYQRGGAEYSVCLRCHWHRRSAPQSGMSHNHRCLIVPHPRDVRLLVGRLRLCEDANDQSVKGTPEGKQNILDNVRVYAKLPLEAV